MVPEPLDVSTALALALARDTQVNPPVPFTPMKALRDPGESVSRITIPTRVLAPVFCRVFSRTVMLPSPVSGW